MLADRQGLLKGDLHVVQRAALSCVIGRELSEQRDTEFEAFRQRMLAAHPEHADGILDMFDRMESGEITEPLSDEDLMNARPMDASNLDEALEQMKTLGIGMMG